jgi:hypothetical protein
MNEQANSSASTPPHFAPVEPDRVIPITFINSKDVLPRRYIIHKHSQRCKTCGTTHEWSQTYACNEMLSRTGAGKLVQHLVPVSELSYNLPVQVVTLTPTILPICHECSTTSSLSHLPDPRSTPEWRRIYAVAQAPEQLLKGRKPSTPKKTLPRTIDDLLEF